MKSSAKNIRLTPVDDLFSSEESRADANRERVVELPLAELHPFKNHPFKVLDDEKMQDTAQSIREHCVLVPAIVRPREEGGYEIVAGHRRHHASQIAGLDTMLRPSSWWIPISSARAFFPANVLGHIG